MLKNKTLFADIASGTNPNGEKVLFYDPSTNLIQYSINPVGATTNKYSSTSRRNFQSTQSTAFQSYLSSNTMLPGLYFVIVCFTFNRTLNTSTRVRVLNNSNSSTFGDLNTLDIQLTTIRYPGVTSGISRLTNSNTFTFQFNREAGQTIVMLVADLVCIQIAP